jgi:hypothetical protein
MLYRLGPVGSDTASDECTNDHPMQSRKKVLARNQQEIVTYIFEADRFLPSCLVVFGKNENEALSRCR